MGSLWLWQVLSFMEPARHTSALFISGFSFDSHEAITTLSPGGLFGGRMAAPPGRHRPIRLLGDDAAWLSLLQVWVSRHAQKTRGSSRCSFLVYAFLNLISG